MDAAFITAIISGISGLVGVWLGGILSRKAALEAAESSNKNAIAIMKQQEFFAAASKFKAAILYELVGFYPINQHWERDQFFRIRDSIPRVNIAAAEFRYFVAGKTDFDNTVSEYSKYSRETTFDSVQADDLYPNMRNEGELGKREQFQKIIEHLISFTHDG